MFCLYIRPTFVRIYKRKSSEGYQSIPYVISLFSAMLWMYYAMIKKDAMMLITINSFAFVIQIVYISLYFFYAPKKEKVLILYEYNLFSCVYTTIITTVLTERCVSIWQTLTVKFVLFVDVLGFGAIFVLTYFLIHANKRVHVLGYICMVFALSVFLAPLGIIVSLSFLFTI